MFCVNRDAAPSDHVSGQLFDDRLRELLLRPLDGVRIVAEGLELRKEKQFGEELFVPLRRVLQLLDDREKVELQFH